MLKRCRLGSTRGETYPWFFMLPFSAAFAVEISRRPLAHEVPLPPSLPPAGDCSSEAQTTEGKNTHVQRKGFPSLDDEAPCWMSQPQSNASCDPAQCTPTCSDLIHHYVLYFGIHCLTIASDGLCSRMIDSLFSFY